MIQPTDQISTEKRSGTEIHDNNPDITGQRSTTTCHVVMHPVQHDLRRTVPASSHVAGHLIVSVPGQTKVQNLGGGGGGGGTEDGFLIFWVVGENEKRGGLALG